MSARDKFHDIVRTALEKDGWTITADPLHLSFGGVDRYLDRAAERLIAAEKDGQSIAVEIKSFLGSSTISDFHLAIGESEKFCGAVEYGKRFWPPSFELPIQI